MVPNIPPQEVRNSSSVLFLKNNFWKILSRFGNISFLNVQLNMPVKLSGSGGFFFERFFTTNLISLICVGLFRLSISS